jgi:hypothetical protein
MPTYSVPVVIEVHGHITVEATDPEEAIERAKARYDRLCADKMKGQSFGALALDVMDSPDIQVDFAYGDDPGSVETDDEEDEEDEEDE